MSSPDSIECSLNRAHDLLKQWNAAYESGEITESDWYREIAAVITPAYLAGNDPR